MAFGSNGQKRFSAKAGGETAQGLSYLVSASRFLTDGYRAHSAADRNVGNVKLSAAIGGDARWTLVANTMKSSAQDPQGLTWEQYLANRKQPSVVAERFNTRKSLEQTQVGMTYERRLSGTHSIALMAYAGHRSMEQYQSIPFKTFDKEAKKIFTPRKTHCMRAASSICRVTMPVWMHAGQANSQS